MTSEEKATQAEAARQAESYGKEKDSVRRWTLIVFVLCLVMMVLYLLADRRTPFTSQARVHANVVPIAAEVAGRLISVDVVNNQQVEAGQLLFQIDAGAYELAVDAANASLKNVIQSVEAGKSNVDAAEATVRSASAAVVRAEQDAMRMRRIQEEDPGAISQRRIESAEAGLEAARGQLAAANSSLEAARAALGSTDETNAQVQQARSALEQAQLNLQKTRVVAPVDGLVTDLRIDKGNFAAAGAPLMTFIAIHDSWIQAELTENNLGHVDVGDRVEVTFDVWPGKVFSGTIRRTGYGVQVSSNPLGTLPTIENEREWLRAAQRFPVAVDFETGGRDLADLRVGSQASVIVYTGDNGLLNLLGRFYIRVHSLFSYAY
jgi:multidrug resistance efflux pump